MTNPTLLELDLLQEIAELKQRVQTLANENEQLRDRIKQSTTVRPEYGFDEEE